MYTNRLIPDVLQFCAGFDKILKAYGDYWLKPDYSEVECLQENKAEKVKWVSQMFTDGIITGDQYLEFMGEETTGLPEMQIATPNVNRMPAGLAETSELTEVINITRTETWREECNDRRRLGK